eukprot:Blabericola_migrator_1__2292@NODE_1636_length_4125_cov_10_996796_g1065_i0_p1_GENE_NODE_1636_length_4125_cov_10_996796_g1065_i0NODE_1636_length_4125_cov_10_996796_g1065_i0_p1_ORF_typecomplete_len1241_score173_74THP2/PF09432_10/1_7e03THP2/PF09432_10/0_94GspL_C/PF12693_7/87GspL_C/PF12693_7/18_NODE_1636_length_4125_cov_10_996796_g1065_i03114033
MMAYSRFYCKLRERCKESKKSSGAQFLVLSLTCILDTKEVLLPSTLTSQTTLAELDEKIESLEAEYIKEWTYEGTSSFSLLACKSVRRFLSEPEFRLGSPISALDICLTLLHRAIATQDNDGLTPLKYMSSLVLRSALSSPESGSRLEGVASVLQELKVLVMTHLASLRRADWNRLQETSSSDIGISSLIPFLSHCFDSIQYDPVLIQRDSVLVEAFRHLDFFFSNHLPSEIANDEIYRDRLRTYVLLRFSALSQEDRTALIMKSRLKYFKLKYMCLDWLEELPSFSSHQYRADATKAVLVSFLESASPEIINRLLKPRVTDFTLSEAELVSGYHYIGSQSHDKWRRLIVSGPVKIPIPDYETASDHYLLKARVCDVLSSILDQHKIELASDNALQRYVDALFPGIQKFVTEVKQFDQYDAGNMTSFLWPLIPDPRENIDDLTASMLKWLKASPVAVMRKQLTRDERPAKSRLTLKQPDFTKLAEFRQRLIEFANGIPSRAPLVRLATELSVNDLRTLASESVDLGPTLGFILSCWSRHRDFASPTEQIRVNQSIKTILDLHNAHDPCLILSITDSDSNIAQKISKVCAKVTSNNPQYTAKLLKAIKSRIAVKKTMFRHKLGDILDCTIEHDMLEGITQFFGKLPKAPVMSKIEQQVDRHLVRLVRAQSGSCNAAVSSRVLQLLSMKPSISFLQRLRKATDLRRIVVALEPRIEFQTFNSVLATHVRRACRDTTKFILLPHTAASLRGIWSQFELYLTALSDKSEKWSRAIAELLDSHQQVMKNFAAHCYLEHRACRKQYMEWMKCSSDEAIEDLQLLAKLVAELPDHVLAMEEEEETVEYFQEASCDAVEPVLETSTPTPRSKKCQDALQVANEKALLRHLRRLPNSQALIRYIEQVPGVRTGYLHLIIRAPDSFAATQHEDERVRVTSADEGLHLYFKDLELAQDRPAIKRLVRAFVVPLEETSSQRKIEDINSQIDKYVSDLKAEYARFVKESSNIPVDSTATLKTFFIALGGLTHEELQRSDTDLKDLKDKVHKVITLYHRYKLGKATNSAAKLEKECYDTLNLVRRDQSELRDASTGFTNESLEVIIDKLRSLPSQCIYTGGNSLYANCRMVRHLVEDYIATKDQAREDGLISSILTAHITDSISACLVNLKPTKQFREAVEVNCLLLRWLLECESQGLIPLPCPERCRLAMSLHESVMLTRLPHPGHAWPVAEGMYPISTCRACTGVSPKHQSC